jgi:hypothetical protein
MATKRKTSKDYRKELLSLKAEQQALEARIIKRAEELCYKYPDVRIGEFRVIDYLRLGENPGEGINLTESLMVMEAIEKDLEAKHPHKQTAIKFPTVVPGGLVGERVIISEGKAYSRKPDCPNSPDGKHHFEFDGSTCSVCGANVAYL